VTHATSLSHGVSRLATIDGALLRAQIARR
jgi:hypothetical protein